MPLRDHFRPPTSLHSSWEEVHGQWPAMMVLRLNDKLPKRFIAVPRVHMGPFVEVDVATFENDAFVEDSFPPLTGYDGAALWSAPEPTATLECEVDGESEYEVRIYDAERNRTLVAAIELISPANKDRPEHRRAFVSKCVALLKREISLVIVDLITVRSFHLYRAILEELGMTGPTKADEPTYAVALRPDMTNGRLRLDRWEHSLEIGQPLPALPLWLTCEQSIRLDLDESYEDTCRGLRIR